MTNNILSSFSEVFSFVWYIILAVLVLLLMITVHEFGHYTVGKLLGFRIDEFSIGFGPKIFSKRKKDGEVFSVRLLPLGGFCAFHGEDSEEIDESCFSSKAPWKRLLVLIAGPIMNYVLALLIVVLMFGIYGSSAIMTYRLQDDAYGEYSFCDRDVIIKANGKNVYILTDLMNATKGKEAGDKIDFVLYREGEVINTSVMLLKDTDYENIEDVQKLYSALGIYYELDEDGEMCNGGLYTVGLKVGFLRTLGRSLDYSVKLAGMIFTVLGQLITGNLGLKSLGGTVTTIGVTANAIKVGGFRYLLNIASLIGVNLAVFNLLPIPALDGSRALFTVIEWIRKKPLNRRVESLIHTVGFIALMIFAVFIDLQQCF